MAIVNVPVEAVRVKPLMLVAVAAPSAGVTSVGEVARTLLPDPVLGEVDSNPAALFITAPATFSAASVVAPVVEIVETPEIVPPVIATAEAACVDIVPNPEIEVFGIVVEAVIVPVPFP